MLHRYLKKCVYFTYYSLLERKHSRSIIICIAIKKLRDYCTDYSPLERNTHEDLFVLAFAWLLKIVYLFHRLFSLRKKHSRGRVRHYYINIWIFLGQRYPNRKVIFAIRFISSAILFRWIKKLVVTNSWRELYSRTLTNTRNPVDDQYLFIIHMDQND